MLPWIIVSLCALVALLVCEDRGFRPGVWVSKPLASVGFCMTAYAAGAIESAYGRTMLCGLVLSLFGDVFLIPKSSQSFLLGLGSFLSAHVAYGLAFLLFTGGVSTTWSLGALAIGVVGATIVLRWLLPHVPAEMRMPVIAYCVVITAMVSLAAGSYGASGRMLILLGAVMFYLSDLSVAKEAFVSPSFLNKAWGLPLYYGAQLLLALSIRGFASRTPT